MKIGKVDLNKEPYIIAEAGTNHDGSYRKAKRLILKAKESGANAVKFQLFSLETLFQADEYERVLGLKTLDWRTVIRTLEFPLKWLVPLKKLSDKTGIDFLCTPFDVDRLKAYLTIKPCAVKIASGDITNNLLLKEAAKSGLPVILSTGASELDEIKKSIKITGKDRTILLDCVMRYPADLNQYSLTRLKSLAELTNSPIGISDHTQSIFLPSEAVYQGACVVEKHFTLNKNDKGADHSMSFDPASFSFLSKSIRDAFFLRKNNPKPGADTVERKYARRALYAARPVLKGEKIKLQDISVLRPNSGGIPADKINLLIGKKASKNYSRGDKFLKS